jgi:DME family drug/metabolite transporter
MPTLTWYSPVWVTTLRGLLIVLYLGIVATALAYMLFTRGVSRIPAATTATLSLAEPLTASLLATLVLGEPFGAARAFGALLLLGGLTFLTLVDDPQTVSGVKRIAFVDRLTVSRRR